MSKILLKFIEYLYKRYNRHGTIISLDVQERYNHIVNKMNDTE